MNYIFRLIFLALFLLALTRPAAAEVRNVIIMISDGCGYNHITSTDYYQVGEAGAQVYESFSRRYGMSTYSYNQPDYDPVLAWTDFYYVLQWATDSGASGTAMSTGVKTYNGVIGISPAGQRLEHLSEYAKKYGKSTGVVTSVPISHATPASFSAHNVSRYSYVQIAQQMLLDSQLDVIMGCGHPFFDQNGSPLPVASNYQYVGGESVWNGLQEGLTYFDTNGDSIPDNRIEDADGDGSPDPWTLIEERADFQELANSPTSGRILGVAQVYKTLQETRHGDPQADPFEEPFIESVPTLAEMAQGALNVLANNPNGFFLMVEGGAIDWAAHDGYAGRMIEEEIGFNDAVEAVFQWIEANSSWDETLLIVTADHETGYLWGPRSEPGDPPVWNDIINRGQGNVPAMTFYSGGHSNSLVPLYAEGYGADLFGDYAENYDPVHGYYIDNTNIAHVVFDLMNPTLGVTGHRKQMQPNSNQAVSYVLSYPNPFNPTMTISFHLAHPAPVLLQVYDARGRQVDTLMNGLQSSGYHQVHFDAGQRSSGVYFYQLRSGSQEFTDRMVFMK